MKAYKQLAVNQEAATEFCAETKEILKDSSLLCELNKKSQKKGGSIRSSVL